MIFSGNNYLKMSDPQTQPVTPQPQPGNQK